MLNSYFGGAGSRCECICTFFTPSSQMSGKCLEYASHMQILFGLSVLLFDATDNVRK
jgi:hypothetical protein